MRIINPRLKSFSFINKADFSGQDNIETADFLKESKTLEFVDICIGNRKSFPNASSKGLAITQTKPKDGKAIQGFSSFMSSPNHPFLKMDIPTVNITPGVESFKCT